MPDTWTAISGYTPQDYTDTAVFEVNSDTKKIALITGQALVAGEKDSQYISFVMPRYWDGIDISSKAFTIEYALAGTYYGTSEAVNAEMTSEQVRFGWIVPETACAISGTLLFVLKITSEEYVLKTQIAEHPVFKTINVEDVVPEPTKEAWYRAFQTRVDSAISEAETAVETAQTTLTEVETSARLAQTAAQDAQAAQETVEAASQSAQTSAQVAQVSQEAAEAAAQLAQTAATEAQGAQETVEAASQSAQTSAQVAQVSQEAAEAAAQLAQTAAQEAQVSPQVVNLSSSSMVLPSGVSLYHLNFLTIIGKIVILNFSIKMESVSGRQNITNFVPAAYKPANITNGTAETGLGDGKCQPVTITPDRSMTLYPANSGTTYAIGSLVYAME